MVLHKYVALYAAHLIKEEKTLDALDLYVKYGSPALKQVGENKKLVILHFCAIIFVCYQPLCFWNIIYIIIQCQTNFIQFKCLWNG